MASVRDYIRINPIDIETNRAVGVSLPFNGTGVFNSTFTTTEQVKSNLLNVILTEPGERIFKPNFGVGLRSQLFENNIQKDELTDRITNQVLKHIPQVELTNVIVQKANDSHELYVRVFYRVIANGENDAIQINFSPDSGVGGTNTTGTSSPSSGGGSSMGVSSGGSSGGGGGY
jgi:phage baseplate assembly protein W